ncbi:hypothetical protein TcCL_ESM03749, partial [Trypanosoma cruzi]
MHDRSGPRIKRSREYDDLTVSTPFQCTSCGLNAQTKVGLLSHLRAHELSKTGPQSAPGTTAHHERPYCARQAGNAGGSGSHTRHKRPDGKNITALK